MSVMSVSIFTELIADFQLCKTSAGGARADSFLALALSVCSFGTEDEATSSENSSPRGRFSCCEVDVLCSYTSLSLHLRKELLFSPWCPKPENVRFHRIKELFRLDRTDKITEFNH